MEKAYVAMPCKDEEEGLCRILPKARPFAKAIFVIDNNSLDNTAKIARSFGAKVLFEGKKGKGNAFRKFLSYFRGKKLRGPVIMIDGDGSYDPNEIPLFLEAIRKGNDIAIGSRFNGRMGKGSMGIVSKAGNRMITFFAHLLYGNWHICDVCCGYWCFSQEALEKIRAEAGPFQYL